MANNFFLNQDPLLFQTPYQRYTETEDELKKQLNENMLQYKLMQQQPNYQKDYIGELDKLSKSIGETTANSLRDNKEYQKLNYELQSLIQDELLANIKFRINNNQKAIKNIERQTEIIEDANKKVEDEQRKNLNELNDYMKNYSNMTFDEYQKIKKGNIENDEDK